MLDHTRYPELDKLACAVGGKRLYHAGLPWFPRLFPRDLFFSAFLFNDKDFLKDVISFAASQQGAKTDPLSGEEPGKVIHEMPGFIKRIGDREYSTAFNASDTTPVLLIGLRRYHCLTGDRAFVAEHKQAARNALDYLFRHLDEKGIFWDDPAKAGAGRYAQCGTYWKDSKTPARENSIPAYPVAYSLVQAMVIAALRSAGELAELLEVDGKELERSAEKTRASLWNLFWDEHIGSLAIGIDREGFIPGLSSDCLHALYYLRPEDVPAGKLEQMVESSKRLETPYGYRTLEEGAVDFSEDSYHLGSIWPFEQAFIAEAGRLHSRPELSRAAEGVMRALAGGKPGGYPETLRWEEGMAQPEITGKSCHTQLWTIAAHHYFSSG